MIYVNKKLRSAQGWIWVGVKWRNHNEEEVGCSFYYFYWLDLPEWRSTETPSRDAALCLCWDISWRCGCEFLWVKRRSLSRWTQPHPVCLPGSLWSRGSSSYSVVIHKQTSICCYLSLLVSLIAASWKLKMNKLSDWSFFTLEEFFLILCFSGVAVYCIERQYDKLTFYFSSFCHNSLII